MVIEYKNKYIFLIKDKTILTLNKKIFKNLNNVLSYFKTKKNE